ncbi:MAG: MFS transporter [Pseudomonadota bacterium]|nr:MFS transporter [Pseudomonadota bacterium]
MADVQTGFGPFIASYLSGYKRTEGEISFALSVGTLTAMISQIPAGAFVDALTGKRLAAALAIVAISLSAVLLACSPSRFPVLIAEVLHGFASCMLTPAIAAISLALVGRRALGRRLGINARWAAVGNGIAAAAMGSLGSLFSTRMVFWFTAILGVPSIAALYSIPRATIPKSKTPDRETLSIATGSGLRILFTDRRLLGFAGCVLLFQLSNAAMLNLAAGEATMDMAGGVQLIIAACIIVPQIVVAALSPWVGRAAAQHGRRPILLLGLAALPIRAVLFCFVGGTYFLVPIQIFDGISAAMLGVMLPLVAADIAGDSGRYNLTIGALGFVGGIGATVSTSMAGFIADTFNAQIAFLALAAAGLGAVLLAWLAMPETSEADEPRLATATAGASD